jgi:hypothetical protein
MKVAKGEREIFLLKVSKEHFLGEDLIHIDFEELFQLFNQDALDKMSRQFLCFVSDSLFL